MRITEKELRKIIRESIGEYFQGQQMSPMYMNGKNMGSFAKSYAPNGNDDLSTTYGGANLSSRMVNPNLYDKYIERFGDPDGRFASYKALSTEINKHIQAGDFGNDERVLYIVNTFTTAIYYAAGQYASRVSATRNAQQRRAAAAQAQGPQVVPQTTPGMVAEGTFSKFGFGGGTKWIQNLFNMTYEMFNKGLFNGPKTKTIATDFMQLLQLGMKKGFGAIVGLPAFLALLGAVTAVNGDSNGGVTGTGYQPTMPPGAGVMAQNQVENSTVNFANNSYQLDANQLQQVIANLQDGDTVTIFVQGNGNPHAGGVNGQRQLDQMRVQQITQAIQSSGKQVNVNSQIGQPSGNQAFGQIKIEHNGGNQGGGRTFDLGTNAGQFGMQYSLEESINRAVRNAFRKILR